MTSAVPVVAAVIVTYNSAEVLADCITSIGTAAADVFVSHVIVVDNDSTDDSVRVAESVSGVKVQVVQMGRNAGYAAGINAAVAQLPLHELDAVLVLNPDVRMQPGSIALLCHDLDRCGVGISVPRLDNPDGSLQISLRRTPTVVRALAEAVVGGNRAGRHPLIGEFISDPAAYDVAQPVAWATGAAMMISTAALQATGPWDESLLLYGEEVDFALRAADHGHSVWYDPAARAEHVGGALMTVPFLYALMTLNRVRVFRTRHGRVRSAAYQAAVTLGELLRAGAGRRNARAACAALLMASRRPTMLPQHD